MRLYSGKVPIIADEIIRTLTADGDIEVFSAEEARLDLEAVMKEFVRRDRQILDEAKNRMERGGLSYSALGKVKSIVAKENNFPGHEEKLPYLVQQLMTMLFHSNNVDEIYCEDVDLRKKITKALRGHTSLDNELDREVRSKIRNLSEGTAAFEIEYAKVMENLKRRKGL